MQVVGVGGLHDGSGCGATAEDGEPEEGMRDADEAKIAARSAAVACERVSRAQLGWPGMQPPFQALLLRQMLDAVGDPSCLRGAKPTAFVPLEQSLDRRPGLEGHEQERQC